MVTILVTYRLDCSFYSIRPQQTISGKLTDTSTTITMSHVSYRIGSALTIVGTVNPLISWNPVWDNNSQCVSTSSTYDEFATSNDAGTGFQRNGLGMGAFAHTLQPNDVASLNIRSNNQWVSAAAFGLNAAVYIYCSASTDQQARVCPNAAEGQPYDDVFKGSHTVQGVRFSLPVIVPYPISRSTMTDVLLDLGDAWRRQLYNPSTNSLTEGGKIVMNRLFGPGYQAYFKFYDINPVGNPPPLDPLNTDNDQLLECGDGTSDCLGEQTGVLSWQVFSTAQNAVALDLPGLAQWFGLIVVVIMIALIVITAYVQFPGQTAITYSWGAICVIVVPSAVIGGLIPFVFAGLFYALTIVGGLLAKMGRWSQ